MQHKTLKCWSSCYALLLLSSNMHSVYQVSLKAVLLKISFQMWGWIWGRWNQHNSFLHVLEIWQIASSKIFSFYPAAFWSTLMPVLRKSIFVMERGKPRLFLKRYFPCGWRLKIPNSQLCPIHGESNHNWMWFSNSWLALGAFPINETIYNVIVCRANFLFALPLLGSWATLLILQVDILKLAMNSRPFICLLHLESPPLLMLKLFQACKSSIAQK